MMWKLGTLQERQRINNQSHYMSCYGSFKTGLRQRDGAWGGDVYIITFDCDKQRITTPEAAKPESS